MAFILSEKFGLAVANQLKPDTVNSVDIVADAGKIVLVNVTYVLDQDTWNAIVKATTTDE